MTAQKTDSMAERFRQLPASLRNGLSGFFGLCGLLVLLDLIVAKHGDHWWTFFGFTCLCRTGADRKLDEESTDAR